MKKDWEAKTLGEVLKLEYGKPLPDFDRRLDGKYPVYGANGIKSRTDKFYCDRFSIIVGRKGSAGEILLTEEKFWPLDVTYFVTFDETKYDLKFLFLLLMKLQLPRFATGVKPGINRNEIYAIKIDIPPLKEQKRIVKILYKKFAVIEKLKNITEQQIKDINDLFESRMSKIFDFSDGEQTILSNVCDLKNGFAFKSNDYVKTSNTLNIRMSNIRPGGYFDPEHNQRFLPDEYVKKFKEYLLYEGDLIIAMTDMAGTPKILAIPTLVKNSTNKNFLLNQRVGKLTNFSNKIVIPYLRYYLASAKIRKYLQSKGVKGVQINLSKSDIMSTPIKLPNIQTQNKIVIDLDKLTVKTNELYIIFKNKIKNLEELKKAYLEQAFSGNL